MLLATLMRIRILLVTFDADPDLDPTFYFDADPSFQIKARYLQKVPK
jgi:hypothetical protein